jgi:SOCE-associated regulatory factor of calcium homoeostasis
LVRSDPSLEQGHIGQSHFSDWRRSRSLDSILQFLFWVTILAVALYIAIGFLRRIGSSDIFRWRRWNGGGGSWSWWPWGGGGGGGGGGHPDGPPPPPYSKFSQSPGYEQTWRPGFWTGLAAGAAATTAANAWTSRTREQPRAPPQVAWDARRTSAMYRNRDVGEGPSSNLGPMRTSSGFGGTRNR